MTPPRRLRIVAALGGNALLRRGEPMDAATQRRNVAAAVRSLASLACDHELVVTHGNGPQVGLLALQGAASGDGRPYPLDVLDAESEGMIGYLLEQELENVLPGRRTATLLTQVVVDPGDPAFGAPAKFIGPVYTRPEAERLAAARGWTVRPDGDAWRRVVPSPEPHRIVELSVIRQLLDAGVLVVCVGGGGIPVAVGSDGRIHGVEAVVDKDLAAALLARDLGADALLLLTDVPGVELGHGAPGAMVLPYATPSELRGLRLAAGSMGPKAEAASRFVEATGGIAVIAALRDAAPALAGRAGTMVVPDVDREAVASGGPERQPEPSQ